MATSRQRIAAQQGDRPAVPISAPEGRGMGRIPVRRGPMEATDFLGQEFRMRWRAYFSNHEEDYQRFIDRERLENTEEVRMQWSAAMMVNALARYGGELDVSYRSVDARAGIRVADDSEAEVSLRDMRGRFRHLLRDIASGARFSDGRSRRSFGAFGDCDEIALLMAQLARGLCEPNGIDIDPDVYRVEKGHASLVFRIGGRRFVFDPSASEEEMPRGLRAEYRRLLIRKGTPQSVRRAIRRSLRSMREGHGPLPLYYDRYERRTAAMCSAMLEQAPLLWPDWERMGQEERDEVREAVRIPRISEAAQERLGQAMERVSARQPPGYLRIQREIRRRSWGHRPDDSIYRLIRARYLPAAMEDPSLRGQAVRTMAELMASSLPGRFEENLAMVGAALERLPEEERLPSLRRIIRVAEGRGMRVALAGIPRR